MDSQTKNILYKLNKDIFIVSIITFAAFFFVELIKPKFVIGYLNLNYILLISVITGVIFTLSPEEAEFQTENQSREKNNLTMLIFSLLVFIVIWLFTRDLGIWGVLVGLVGGLAVFLIGIVLNEEEIINKNKKKNMEQ